MTTPKPHLLLIDDDPNTLASLSRAFRLAGYEATVCAGLPVVHAGEVTPSMRDIAGTAGRRTVRTPSADQVRAGLNRQGLGRWRAYARDLAPVMATLAPWVARFGYPPD